MTEKIKTAEDLAAEVKAEFKSSHDAVKALAESSSIAARNCSWLFAHSALADCPMEKFGASKSHPPAVALATDRRSTHAAPSPG